MVSKQKKKRFIDKFDCGVFLGVDDGQFGKIIAHEIPAIRQAFNGKFLNRKSSLINQFSFSNLW